MQNLHSRLTSSAEFLAINGWSPVCGITGFDSWRVLPCLEIQFLKRFEYNQGIYPDVLHICDLAIYKDMYASTFMLFTDDQSLYPLKSRNERLMAIYREYVDWCVENRRSLNSFAKSLCLFNILNLHMSLAT